MQRGPEHNEDLRSEFKPTTGESRGSGHLVSHSLSDKAQVIKQTVVASTEAQALRMWRQKDKKFKPSLGYLQNHVSGKKK